MSYTAIKSDYLISTDKTKIDISYVHSFLTRSYWSPGIPVEIVRKAIEGSLCFAVYHNNKQVGFARVITDKATFAYLADVFIDENYRGRGLSKWLMATIMKHPDLQGLRRMLLTTKDAHGLYAQFGFIPINNPERFMIINNPEVYKTK
jgi:N-acetylglutamate synthase-like GNAT family acetyltransferase